MQSQIQEVDVQIWSAVPLPRGRDWEDRERVLFFVPSDSDDAALVLLLHRDCDCLPGRPSRRSDLRKWPSLGGPWLFRSVCNDAHSLGSTGSLFNQEEASPGSSPVPSFEVVGGVEIDDRSAGSSWPLHWHLFPDVGLELRVFSLCAIFGFNTAFSPLPCRPPSQHSPCFQRLSLLLQQKPRVQANWETRENFIHGRLQSVGDSVGKLLRWSEVPVLVSRPECSSFLCTEPPPLLRLDSDSDPDLLHIAQTGLVNWPLHRGFSKSDDWELLRLSLQSLHHFGIEAFGRASQNVQRAERCEHSLLLSISNPGERQLEYRWVEV